MKLTPEHIQELYKFTRAHFVYHFDLQTELVDHLAYGIEAQIAKNPKLTFQDALDKEFKKFGIFGFQDVIAERQKALSKRYWKIILRFYKEYFTLPKLALTLLLSTLLYYVLKTIAVEYQFYVLAGLFMSIFIIGLFKIFKYKRVLKNKERKWMLEEMLLNQMGIGSFIQFPIHFFNFTGKIENLYLLAIVCLIVVAALLLFYVILFVIPPKAEELLSETYPEYKLMHSL